MQRLGTEVADYTVVPSQLTQNWRTSPPHVKILRFSSVTHWVEAERVTEQGSFPLLRATPEHLNARWGQHALLAPINCALACERIGFAPALR